MCIKVYLWLPSEFNRLAYISWINPEKITKQTFFHHLGKKYFHLSAPWWKANSSNVKFALFAANQMLNFP